MRKLIALTALAATAGCAVHNNYNQNAPTYAAGSTVSAADRASITATLAGVYAVISGPSGQERDWDAMRAMFTDDARLYAVTPDGGLRGGTVEDYIANSGPFLTQYGFSESELTNRVEVYGDVAHAWSSYEGAFVRDGAEVEVRGINSFQLHRQADGGWKVHSIFWQQETPDLPLPADMEAM